MVDILKKQDENFQYNEEWSSLYDRIKTIYGFSKFKTEILKERVAMSQKILEDVTTLFNKLKK